MNFCDEYKFRIFISVAYLERAGSNIFGCCVAAGGSGKHSVGSAPLDPHRNEINILQDPVPSLLILEEYDRFRCDRTTLVDPPSLSGLHVNPSVYVIFIHSKSFLHSKMYLPF